LYWSQPVEGEGLSSRGGTIIQADGEERGTNTFTCQANKVCVGTNKAATIRAKGGNGTIIARGGDDTISDGPDEDSIQGGPGNDTINDGSSDEASTSETELLQDDAGPRYGNPADVDRIFAGAGQETTSVFDCDTEDLLDRAGDFASVAADPGGDEIVNCSKKPCISARLLAAYWACSVRGT
jgi:Ca2+-binding RTX toxin-like protein